MVGKSDWLMYKDEKESLKFRADEEGGFEIEEYNGKPAPEDKNSEEYSKWMFGSMNCLSKAIIPLLDKND